ncbi:CTP synthase [Syntrophaceticus schinkii]|uniref:CTP synthase n=1 Tax=Syntrophaceticus schinkii TaxID=499207 RepID=A0A0B7MNY7_9FIRM|nr:CTP synthase [Syntrophaceticus schinkii]CEO89963.1 CTP synthetase [Syntrophaceticus schinkii]
MTKYIFVTGGVVSSLGKGITAASLGRLLKSRGFSVIIQKFDPYINIDPGTMSPYQHGEVFVTDDGAETDLDLGHYERFLDQSLSQGSNVTAGRIYNSVIHKERRGEYHGGTVQVIPHITNEIKDYIQRVADEENTDIVITEIGGTVGDIESLPFLEAIRQFKTDIGREHVLYLHVTLVPYLRAAQELKTKPTQHSVKELRSIGIQPDIIVCRSEEPLTRELKDKIALFCDIDKDAVIEVMDAQSIYQVPLMLEEQGMAEIVSTHLNLPQREPYLEEWKRAVRTYFNPKKSIRVAVVGKYVELKDAYLSVAEALCHGGLAHETSVQISWVDAEGLEEENPDDVFQGVQGILVPGGFGSRGIAGKIKAAGYAREKRIPFLGICLGMQCAVIEFARSVCGLKDANSTEFDPQTPDAIVSFLPGQENQDCLGGTMRLGKYPCKLVPDSKAYAAYGKEMVEERHRHRYEINNTYRELIAEKGMRITGTSPDGRLVEIVELPEHPWFVACQFHPEFKSRLNRPHPLFRDFIRSSTAADLRSDWRKKRFV